MGDIAFDALAGRLELLLPAGRNGPAEFLSFDLGRRQ
jgi:hypothetical protein